MVIAGTSPIHWTVIGAGGAVNTGAIVSVTVINCVTVDVFPQESVNVHVLVMIAGHVPDGELSVPITDPGALQLSVYVREIIAGMSPTHCTVIGTGGAANTGAIVSVTVINWVTVDVFPQESVNVHVLVMIAGHVPDGALSVPITEPDGTQLSVYVNAIMVGTSPTH